MAYRYTIYGKTDAGNVKTVNEDVFYTGGLSGACFSLVADGMGGLEGGEKAAGLMRDSFSDWFALKAQHAMQGTQEVMEERLVNDWEQLLNDGNRMINGMEAKGGTTFTALLLYNGSYYTVNIGDSRIYRFGGNELYQLTTDHSWAQDALEHAVSARQIESDPRRNMLTRCIGGGMESVNADYGKGGYAADDMFLLCSDGLRRLVSVNEIKDMLRRGDVKDAAENLVALAKEKGERDNITCVVIKVENDE